MPARIHDSAQPNSSQTFAEYSLTPGATPLYLPFEAAPLPVMVDATWVPCPTRSMVSVSSVKFCAAITLPARSGWMSSIPVSTTATGTPCPVNPACQATGAPISGTLTSRDGCRIPSSRTVLTSSRRVRAWALAPGLVRLFHNAEAPARFSLMATPFTAGRSRPTAAPAVAALDRNVFRPPPV